MMITASNKHQESNFSSWRALAINTHGKEHMIFTDKSYEKVLKIYSIAFEELLEDEEKQQIKAVILQEWYGTPDRGEWKKRKFLKIPQK
jgi:hypothetical protein